MPMVDKEGADKPLEKGGEGDCSEGPIKKRKCTDILCCLFFIAHWLLLLVVFSMICSMSKLSHCVGRELVVCTGSRGAQEVRTTCIGRAWVVLFWGAG